MSNPNVLIIHQSLRWRWSNAQKEVILAHNRENMPNVKKNQAYYLCLVDYDPNRLYHIQSWDWEENDLDGGYDMVFIIGNTFLFDKRPDIDKDQLFEYKPVTSFGLMEIQPGVLVILPNELVITG